MPALVLANVLSNNGRGLSERLGNELCTQRAL